MSWDMVHGKVRIGGRWTAGTDSIGRQLSFAPSCTSKPAGKKTGVLLTAIDGLLQPKGNTDVREMCKEGWLHVCTHA